MPAHPGFYPLCDQEFPSIIKVFLLNFARIVHEVDLLHDEQSHSTMTLYRGGLSRRIKNGQAQREKLTGKTCNDMIKPTRPPASRKYLFAAIAFVLQASWAGYANYPYGVHIAAQAALLHGFLCAGQTLVSALVMEFFYGCTRILWLKLGLPVFGTLLVLTGLATGLHWLNHTPDVLRTILPLLILGLPYYCLYTFLLWRADQNRHAANYQNPLPQSVPTDAGKSP